MPARSRHSRDSPGGRRHADPERPRARHSLSTTTDASGGHRFEALQPGRYRLRVSAPGPLPFERGEIPVGDERVSRVNLPLLAEKPGQ